MSDRATSTIDPDIHPLDHALGIIHEMSLALAIAGQHDAGMRLATAHAAIQGYLLEYVDPPTIEARLLFVARELKELDSLYCSHKFYEQQSDALGDIESQRYDRAISKLTGNYEPPDGDPREGGICDGN